MLFLYSPPVNSTLNFAGEVVSIIMAQRDPSQPINGVGSTAAPYIDYMFNSDDSTPLAVTMQENRPYGAFLWVVNSFSKPSEDALSTHYPTSDQGTSHLELLYIPDTKTFHLVVGASGSYSLHVISKTIQALRTTQMSKLSRSNPVEIYSLQGIWTSQRLQLTLRSGKTAIFSIMQDNHVLATTTIEPSSYYNEMPLNKIPLGNLRIPPYLLVTLPADGTKNDVEVSVDVSSPN